MACGYQPNSRLMASARVLHTRSKVKHDVILPEINPAQMELFCNRFGMSQQLLQHRQPSSALQQRQQTTCDLFRMCVAAKYFDERAFSEQRQISRHGGRLCPAGLLGLRTAAFCIDESSLQIAPVCPLPFRRVLFTSASNS